MNAVSRAIECLGGPAKAASELDVSIQRVVNWRRRGKVPGSYAIPIEEATGGRVSRWELRPDIFGERAA